MRYLWLALAFLVGMVAVIICRRLGFSQETTATLAGIPTLLLLFPFVKRWMPKTNFAYWAIGVGFAAGVSWLLYLALSGVSFK